MRINEFGQPIGDAVSFAGAMMPESVELIGRIVLAVPLSADQSDAFYERIFGPDCDESIMTYSRQDLYPDRAAFDAGFESMMASRDPLFLRYFASRRHLILEPVDLQAGGIRAYEV